MFLFYKRPEAISDVVPGGLEVFQELNEQDEIRWQQFGIKAIGERCTDSGRPATVTRHFVFGRISKRKGRWPVPRLI